ncbi:peptide chain release factor N(5)-glutamine methyltransferase [Aurantibacter sp.]|uniref:peptide chain release factor N(5)-glutamine methyltransferase n=1 Tax=Aurantibacter sp. TaxID=2807103 RepID=UPI003265837B
MLLREIKNIFHLELDTIYGKDEVASFFYILIEHYLNLERFVLAFQPDLNIRKEDEKPLFEGLAKLKSNQPIQYIIGNTIFMDLDFIVNENVLIPRPETEELVRWIIKIIKEKSETNSKNDKLKILDIGTGSGCIAIALAKNLSNANLYALDVSLEALSVAKKNALQNEVEITFINADILQNVNLEEHFDIIVSNPPYVRELEKTEMTNNVLEFEPSLALFVTDENPLIFYNSITEFASKKLKVGGVLFFEINQYLAKETQQLLEANNFQDIELRKDIFGNDRMLMAVK